jgi:hypothetical protein
VGAAARLTTTAIAVAASGIGCDQALVDEVVVLLLLGGILLGSTVKRMETQRVDNLFFGL